MNKEQFVAIGLPEDMAEKAAAASQDELKSFIPKARFDEVNDAKKRLEKDVSERDGQLEELKKSTGDAEALKAQITQLQTDNKAAKDKYEADLKDLKLSSAIQTALAGKVHDEALVAGLVDKTKLVVDGDKIVGLEEQVKSLQESKAFLFKPEGGNGGQGGAGGFQRVGGGGGQGGAGGGAAGGKQPSLMDAVAAHFNNNK